MSGLDHEKTGVEMLGLSDERFPKRLREIPEAPSALFVRGDVERLAMPKLVAVIGTREPTEAGKSVTVELTEALGRAGWGIVSGLAKGVDTLAHRAALEVGAPTIAVMGGGLDSIYPPENTGLAERILEAGGALVSEHPPGTPARPVNLARRNRLQSGLAAAGLITQCSLKGGTMHTARFAALQGRPVFCPVPDDTEPASDGVLALLERPVSGLCDELPAWRNARSLYEQFGDRPLAKPIGSGEVEAFLANLDAAS